MSIFSLIPWSALAAGTLRWGKVIALSGLVAGVALYVRSAERAKGLVEVLESENAQYRLTTDAQAEQIDTLNGRIKANNERWLAQVKRETERLERARAEAQQVRKQRDQITAELSASRRAWQEQLRDDADLADFIALDVPGPVWDRLRAANSEGR